MKWFTREWASGGLADLEWERRRRDYESHVDSISTELRNGSDSLVSEVNLHDAQVQSWSLVPDGAFRLVALIGDLQVGYEMVTLTYEAATTNLDSRSLADQQLNSRRIEIWYDEIDLREGGRFVHSILFHPSGELEINFGGLKVERTPASPAERR